MSHADEIIRLAMSRADRLGLHVRVTGIPDRKEPFNFYAKDEASRDDFIRRYKAAGFVVEIVR